MKNTMGRHEKLEYRGSRPVLRDHLLVRFCRYSQFFVFFAFFVV